MYEHIPLRLHNSTTATIFWCVRINSSKTDVFMCVWGGVCVATVSYLLTV